MSADAAILNAPPMVNEPACLYEPGSEEAQRLDAQLSEMQGVCAELPLHINGRDVRTDSHVDAVMPHRADHVLAHIHQAGASELSSAVSSAGVAWEDWHRTPWTERAAIFLRAASLAAGPWRETLNASTMLGQSKTIDEADADAACELADFFRLNVSLLPRLYGEQPVSDTEAWNQMEYRPLEGFVFAVTPFNFTAIAANLPSAPALMGNTVVWKPAATAALSAHYVMQLLRHAGLPDGVINLVHGDGATVADHVLASHQLAGIHFTGSSTVLRALWSKVGDNIDNYAGFPRIVGETGGKDFLLAHPSADPQGVLAAVIRGAFEYQGQKCSAVSRLFVPKSLWPDLRDALVEQMRLIKVGDVAQRDVYMGAVINAASRDRQAAAIREAAAHSDTRVLIGGVPENGGGFFVEPTLIETSDARFRLLRDELFGPVVTTFVYPDHAFEDVLTLIDQGAPYGLTGSIFAESPTVLARAAAALRYAAGNLYLNDKPTGAIVGKQPFGGSRASGTNDKVGSIWHLSRWVSPRSIKLRHVAPIELRHHRDGVSPAAALSADPVTPERKA